MVEQLTYGADPRVDFSDSRVWVMAIVNRTADSFFADARHLDMSAAQRKVSEAVQHGADIIDIGGVPAGVGREVSVAEEIERTAGFASWVHAEFPSTVVSVDTWRAEVAEAALEAGAGLINDTWAGWDPQVVPVVAQANAGVVCSHTGGAVPRTNPERVSYGKHPHDVVEEVVHHLGAAAQRAEQVGIDPRAILVDPTLDFGKNTWHSLALLRNTDRLVRLGYPVLIALSRKDFVGETLALPDAGDRLEGSLAATAVAVWLGAKVFRTHDVQATRRTVDMVSSVKGERLPSTVWRGLL